MGEFNKLRAAFDRAVKDWNLDAGPPEHTVKVGEELYFAAHNLIGELTEQRDALLEAAQALDAFWIEAGFAPPGESDEPRLLTVETLEVWRKIRAAIAKALGEGQ